MSSGPRRRRPGGWRTGEIDIDFEALVIHVRHVEPRVVPADVPCQRGYRAFRVRGPLPLDLIGILASIAGPLATAGVSIFAISTYDTDYVLVSGKDLDVAIGALKHAGHEVTP
jgi:hypothetical protein